MSRHDKQERRLEALETELRGRLLPLLAQVAQGRGTAFFVSSPQKTAIQSSAQEIIKIAENLGLPRDGLLASRILNAFDEANDTANEHRLGPIRLAQTLLAEISSEREQHGESTAP